MAAPPPWSPRAAPRLWAVGAVALFSLVSFVHSMRPVRPLSERPGFDAAVAHLRAATAPATFVVVWPPEQAAALGALPRELRAADAVPVETASQRSVLRVLVLGPSGFDAPPELAEASAGERVRFDEVEVAPFEWAGGDRIDFDLRAGLAGATIRLEGREHRVTCDQPRPDGGWACPGRPSWNHVAPTRLRVGGDDWPCVWSHPVTGHELIVDLGEHELWDRVELEAALHDDVTGVHGSTVVLRLEVDGAGSRRLTRTNQRGVARTVLPTVRGRRARVRVLITTANDSRRHLGVNLRILETR